MRFVDLCAGIGGFRLGFEQTGHTCVGYAEIDKFARQSYEAMFDTEGEWTLHDIKQATDEQIRQLRGTDIILAGFPCQAFSAAGKKRGFADERGTIFYDVCRFIKIIKPRYVVCENVRGLLWHNHGSTFRVILSALDGLGYSVEWQVLNSKNFGVPQSRERVYIVGHLGSGGTGKVFPISPLCGANPHELSELTQGMSMGERVYDVHGISKCLSANGGGWGAKMGLYDLTGIDLTTNKPKATSTARCIQARYDKGYSNRQAECTGITDGIRIRKLTPLECWRLQGFPDEYYQRARDAGLSDTQAYKQAGNAVTVNVARAIAERLGEIDAV